MTTRLTAMLLAIIAGAIALDQFLAEGRWSLFVARHFVNLLQALAFWR